MCKILFWSPLHGQGQTSNLHVTALIMSLMHKKRVLMMQTHFAMNNLEGPLVGKNVDHKKSDENEIFQDIGLDVAITFSNMNQLNPNILESCCLTFPDTSLLLLPGTETKNKETFARDIGNAVCRMIQKADENVDIVLIDSNSGDDELSFRMMSVADLVVVNLTQRRYVLEKFFMNYGDRIINNNKVFYLFGDYDDNSSYNINNCRVKYRKYINNNNSGVIPYCTQYMDAQNDSDVLRFMQKGLHTSEDGLIEKIHYFIRNSLRSGKYNPHDTDNFFYRSRLAVEKMLDTLNISIKMKHREEVLE